MRNFLYWVNDLVWLASLYSLLSVIIMIAFKDPVSFNYLFPVGVVSAILFGVSHAFLLNRKHV